MVELDYMILYTNDGIPIYSYKFNLDFQISDEFLLSAFLTSLNQYAMHGEETDRPDNLMLEEKEIQIEYSEELKLSTVEVDQTVLVFYYGDTADLTVGIGINKRNFTSINSLFTISQLMVEIEQFMQDYLNLDWRDVEHSVLNRFEKKLHSEVIHKFMDAHTADEDCYLEEFCPFKLASDEELKEPKSLGDRIRSRFGRNRS